MAVRAEERVAISDRAVRERTGRSWDEWFAILDRFRAGRLGHRPTVEHLRQRYSIGPWWSQVVSVRYQQERGLRAQAEPPAGHVAAVWRAIDVPAETAFAALVDRRMLERWLGLGCEIEPRPGGRVRLGGGSSGECLAIEPPRRLRLSCERPRRRQPTAIEIAVVPRGRLRSVVQVREERLARQSSIAPARQRWGTALDRLKRCLEAAAAHGRSRKP